VRISGSFEIRAGGYFDANTHLAFDEIRDRSKKQLVIYPVDKEGMLKLLFLVIAMAAGYAAMAIGGLAVSYGTQIFLSSIDTITRTTVILISYTPIALARRSSLCGPREACNSEDEND
jgi:hypothetical protein